MISLKVIMESSIHIRWIIPFKKFGTVRVKNKRMISQHLSHLLNCWYWQNSAYLHLSRDKLFAYLYLKSKQQVTIEQLCKPSGTWIYKFTLYLYHLWFICIDKLIDFLHILYIFRYLFYLKWFFYQYSFYYYFEYCWK